MTVFISTWVAKMIAAARPSKMTATYVAGGVIGDVDSRDYELSFWRAAFSVCY